MPCSPNNRCPLVGGSCKFYALLVLAYSPHFRQRYGGEMVRVFGDCCQAAWERDGVCGLGAAWGRALVDLVCNAPVERVQDILRDPASRWLLAALAPFALLLAGLIARADVCHAEVQGPVRLLILFTAFLGFAHPRLASLWALVLGASVPATQIIAGWRGWQLPYVIDGWTPVCALLALVPAFCGAYAGALARRLVKPLRANLQTTVLVLVVGALCGACVYQGVRVLTCEPETALAERPHDPWQTLVRSMDPTSFVFRKGNVIADESSEVGDKPVALSPPRSASSPSPQSGGGAAVSVSGRHVRSKHMAMQIAR
jgi:hypothetical protein